MKYILMNRNIKILEFECVHEFNAFLGVNKVYDFDYAPLSLKYCDKNAISPTFLRWLDDRKIPPIRDNFK